MAKFVATFTYVDMDKRAQTRPRHLEYLRQLYADGKLHEAGAFADQRGAMIVYETATEQLARDLLAADPYNQAGVIGDIQLREWNISVPG